MANYGNSFPKNIALRAGLNEFGTIDLKTT